MRELKDYGNAAWTAPLVVPIVVAVLSLVVDRGFTELAALMVFFAAVVSYAGSFALGYPLAILLDRKGALSMWTLTVIGLTGGGLVGVVVPLFLPRLFGPYTLPPSGFILALAGFGALVAISFGLMAKVRWTIRRS
ncbi:MAG: hypothetical protein WBM57_15550 [Woeseiaceae bacterium]